MNHNAHFLKPIVFEGSSNPNSRESMINFSKWTTLHIQLGWLWISGSMSGGGKKEDQRLDTWFIARQHFPGESRL